MPTPDNPYEVHDIVPGELVKLYPSPMDVQPGDSKFQFYDGNTLLFTIMADGTIVRGPGFTTDDEMSLKFWEAVEATRRPLVPIK